MYVGSYHCMVYDYLYSAALDVAWTRVYSLPMETEFRRGMYEPITLQEMELFTKSDH